MVAIFERNHVDLPHRIHFEVVILRPVKQRTIFGKIVEAHEAYPASEQWGTYGFTYSTRQPAEVRFAKTVEILDDIK